MTDTPTPASTPISTPLRGLLNREPSVVTAGVGLLADALRAQAAQVTEVDWRPPMAGTEADLAAVMSDPRREAANAQAVSRLMSAGAELVDVRPAHECLGIEKGTFFHAGPPMSWGQAPGPMRGALIGAMLYEGLAETPEQAEAALAAGDGITLDPCHHHHTVGPMAGVVSPSMWMFQLRDPVHGGTAFCSLNEGLGRVLRYGAYSPEVIDRLNWMERVLGPLLQQAVRAHGPVDVKAIIARLATRIPKIAHIFEIAPDRNAPRPKIERRRPPKKQSTPPKAPMVAAGEETRPTQGDAGREPVPAAIDAAVSEDQPSAAAAAPAEESPVAPTSTEEAPAPGDPAGGHEAPDEHAAG